ncbi:MAG: DNA-directed RNA polymerase subunit H [Candidatus Micrarchaeota archaeon]
MKEKLEHQLVPEHILLSAEEKAKVIAKFKSKAACFPKINASDPALIGMGAEPGVLIHIKRKDFTGNYDYYRIVVKG